MARGPRCRECGEANWNREGRCRQCNVFPTLGYLVGDWIEAHCVIPDGDLLGEPFILTDEMWRFLLRFYRVNPRARRMRERWSGYWWYERGAQLVRPQKWGKGPLASAWVCAEAEGPVLFDGWDAEGQPVGRPWATPWIQVTAVSEDQTANIWRALVPMIERGVLSQAIYDTGETRINLPGGGKIEPVTHSGQSRLGQRITASVQDEAHAWLKANGGHLVADTQRRNLAGMGGRFLETGNAWDPRENSVAQLTSESQEPGVLFDDVEPGAGSVRNKAERRRMLRKVYGDSWWVDPDRIDLEIQALLARGDAAQAERYFLNRKEAGEDAAFDMDVIAKLEDEDRREAEHGALIVVGVDGARFSDALAIVATEIETGLQWPLGIWERPRDAGDDYEHPFAEIDGVMLDADETWDIWRIYIDPQWIDHLVDKWEGRWERERVHKWQTHRPRQIAWAVRGFVSAIASGEWSHSGDPDFLRHLKNARKRKLNVFDEDHRQMFTLAKERPDSPRKIDAAMAGVLSWEARGDAIAANAQPRRKGRVVSFA